MKKFRVECNFGNKFFTRGVDAFDYFYKQAAQGFNVEVYLREVEITKKSFYVSEELLSYSLGHKDFSNALILLNKCQEFLAEFSQTAYHERMAREILHAKKIIQFSGTRSLGVSEKSPTKPNGLSVRNGKSAVKTSAIGS